MKIMKILEQIASNVHYKISNEELSNIKSDEIRIAFLTKDIEKLKKQLTNDKNLADRCTIFKE